MFHTLQLSCCCVVGAGPSILNIMTQVRFPSVVPAAIFSPSAGPPAAAIFLHLCWSFCCAKNKVEREEARSAKTSSAQTREKELGRWFFSKFFTAAQENVEMG